MTVKLVSREQRLPPSRGLVLTHNHAGKSFAAIDQNRWVRYSRLVNKTDKIDILANGVAATAIMDPLDLAVELRMAPSLRTDCAAPPPDLDALHTHGLHDVFLCPRTLDSPELDAWLRACRARDIPIRLQIQAPFTGTFDAEAEAERFAEAGVAVANIALTDPFSDRPAASEADSGPRTLESIQRLAQAIETNRVEVNILHVPFCLLDNEDLIHAANSPQCALDHQHYTLASYDLAALLYRRSPLATRGVLRILHARYTLYRNTPDDLLYPWLLHREFAHVFAGTWRRLSGPLRFFRRGPREATGAEIESEIAAANEKALKKLGPACSQCRLRRICDHWTDASKQMLPGMEPQALDGETVVSPLHFSALQPKYYDEIDAARSDLDETDRELSEKALEILRFRPPDRTLSSEDYDAEDIHFSRMEGGIKWYSVSNREAVSTPLAHLEPPFTIAVDFAGGIADFVGFSLGRHCKLLCPMETYKHTVALHVAADGRYVLLRDDKPIRPVEFEGHYYTPLRLGDRMEPRLSLMNIEDSVTTHNIRVWEEDDPPVEPSPQVKYSIIIVSTRFARRLQAVLRNIAHQKNFDLAKLEVIVSYVPGLDATDDLIDSVAISYPGLRILRSPFPERNANSKGFLINESFRMATGEWVMLLDSDTLLPPEMFARIDEAADTAEFIAPDGRKLLTKETTAKILMGEIKPWEQWDMLLKGPGEYRHREARGVPVGFCQCFKAHYLERFRYKEMENFEWADMDFGETMIEEVGKEHRLSGLPVIHLDHGSSQWFGTTRHL